MYVGPVVVPVNTLIPQGLSAVATSAVPNVCGVLIVNAELSCVTVPLNVTVPLEAIVPARDTLPEKVTVEPLSSVSVPPDLMVIVPELSTTSSLPPLAR